MLDVLHILLDDAQFDAVDRNFSRQTDPATGKPRNPEYAHEFLMKNDPDYFAAWAYLNSEAYRLSADANPPTLDAVIRGQSKHTYLENDPDIVWRSLLRNNMRLPEEGEEYPPEVLGTAAPDAVISIPMTVQTEYGSTGWF
jgi:hypothetical protein